MMKALYLICSIAWLLCSHVTFAKSSEFAVENGLLYFGKALIPTNFNMSQYKPNQEVGFLFAAKHYKQLALLKIISPKGENEIWLHNTSDLSMTLIETHPISFSMSWLSENCFITERKHMGISVSFIHIINDDNTVYTSNRIGNLIKYYPKRKLMVTRVPSVGEEFRFAVRDISGEQLFTHRVAKFGIRNTDQLFAIKDVTFNHCEMVFHFKHKPKQHLSLNKKHCEIMQQTSQ